MTDTACVSRPAPFELCRLARGTRVVVFSIVGLAVWDYNIDHRPYQTNNPGETTQTAPAQ